MMKLKLNRFLLFYLVIIYSEMVFKAFSYNRFFDSGLFYMLIFSIPFALAATIISNLWQKKGNFISTIILVTLLLILFETQLIFKKLFSIILSINSFEMVDQAADFADTLAFTIKQIFFPFIFLLIPLILLIIFRKKIDFNRAPKQIGYLFICLFITAIVATLTLQINKNKLYSAYRLFYKTNDLVQSASTFGLLTTTKLDIERYIFGFQEEVITKNRKKEKIVPEIKYNVTNVDFTSLTAYEKDNTIKNMNQYFSNEVPSKQNKYTGLFKGKNLIFILAEGFNSIAVNKDITPTFYKLVNESFVFKNFYTPVFLSTTGGEFQALTGLVPNQGVLSTWKQGKTSLPYAIGNSFAKQGYFTYAFHNWTYSYYDRQKTMPSLGFPNYLACGNGLQKLMNCHIWPTSDIDMIRETTPYYLNQELPFVSYYITLSGHRRYNWTGNNVASRNHNLVRNLPYSEDIKAYLATQIELDKALELLIQKLTEFGKLDDTVIVMVGDHYPYDFSAKQMNEISDFERDNLFGVNKSNLIIWNANNPTKEITKTAGSIDVLPTILNLWGIEYDSRLIIGKDILSDKEGLVMLSNRSWVTDKGRYNANTKVFEPFDKSKDNDEYIKHINERVYNNFSLSDLIINKNYYQKTLN